MFGLGDYTRLPTIGSHEELATLFLLYSLGFVLIFTFVSLMYRHATRRAEVLGLGPGELREAHLLKRHYGLFALVGLLSMLLAWLDIGVAFGMPGWIYVILGPLCWAHDAWSNRGRSVTAL